MGKKTKSVVVTMCVLILLIFFGCTAVQDVITPCYIEPDAGAYAGKDELTSFMPFTSLWDAENVDRQVDDTHKIKQVELTRLLEDDTFTYSFLKDLSLIHIHKLKNFNELYSHRQAPLVS